MIIMFRVCADFYDKRNNRLYHVDPRDLGKFVDAPETIREDPLFKMLVDDKSIKFPEDAKTNKALENDPYAGATAEGKEIKVEAAVKTKAADKTKVTSKAKNTPSGKENTSSALRAPAWAAARSSTENEHTGSFSGRSEPPQGEGLNDDGNKPVEEPQSN